MVRLSSYSILSEPLPGGGFALMNGLNGAIDLISADVASGLIHLGGFHHSQGTPFTPPVPLRNDSPVEPEEMDEALVDFLLERGHLTRLAEAEEQEQMRFLAETLHEADLGRPVFMIVPTFDCNYRCTYCFERPLQRGLVQLQSAVNYSHGNVVMRQEHINALYEAIRKIKAESGDTSTGGNIVLYGGEPLDARNRDVVTEIVQRGVAEGFKFSAISNGHDWEHFTHLMGDNGISQIQVSIDGPGEIHDKRRVHVKGESSFLKILENVRLALNVPNTVINIRIHIDPSNAERFPEVLATCEEQGWLNNPQVVVYANTVYSKNKEGNVAAQIANGEIMRQLQDYAKPYHNVFIAAPAINARMQVLGALATNQPYRMKSTYCAANTGNYIFAPDGQIYACWESVGKECSRVGSYMGPEGLALDKTATERWFTRSVARIPECQRCPYALSCGGGCAQYSEYNTGSLNKPFCDDFEGIFRQALADNIEEYIQRMTSEPESETENEQAFPDFWKTHTGKF